MTIFKRRLPSINLPHYKNTMNLATEKMPVPHKIVISMSQHIGKSCTPLVKVGDTVKVGQIIGDSKELISSPIHSSVSGEVIDIDKILAASGISNEVVIIKPDGQQDIHPTIKPPKINNHEQFLQAVRNCGLVGLGGAAFPAHVKYSPKNLHEVDTLIINGAECEPFITSDYRNMMEESENIFHGIKEIMNYLEIANCYIGIEKNKPAAIEKFRELSRDLPQIKIVPLRNDYPQGAERVLIYETTGKILTLGHLPADIGVIVSNITTVETLGNYLKTGMPLISKKITVDGPAVSNPKNIEVLIGTLIMDVIEFCGGYKKKPRKIIMGGPMMGRSIYSDQTPIIKHNNAILVFDETWAYLPKESACINCARCAFACPMGLYPMKINKAYKKGDLDELLEHDTLLCIECGCCSYVCPAKIQVSFINSAAKELVRKGEQPS
ncbi:MAG: electron transport complex subunit RsxC [Bacillota bacterium]|jgi:electron transport complex protein RnfC